MIRSFSSREKMSYARSPRGVCSTTIGTSPTAPPTWPDLPSGMSIAWCDVVGRFDLRVLDEQRQDFRLAERQAEPVQLVAPLEQAPDGLGRPPRLLGQARHLGVHVRLAGGQLLARGNGLEEQRAAHGALRVGPQLAGELLVVPPDRVRVDALAPEALAPVPDPVRDL